LDVSYEHLDWIKSMISWIGLDWVSKNGPMSQLSDPASWYMLSRDANVASCPYWWRRVNISGNTPTIQLSMRF